MEATKDFNKDLMINIDELFAGLPLAAYPTKIGVESSGHLVIYGKVSK